MQPDLKRALVFGGTGAVGSEVVRQLTSRGVDVTFTWFRSETRARELPGTAIHADLRDLPAIREACAAAGPVSIFIHCAVVNRSETLGELTDADYAEAFAVNVRAPYVAIQALAPALSKAGESHIVLVGALDRSQSLPLPIHFAATQAAISGLTVALSKELGPHGTRVNLVALGPLDSGLSRELPAELLEEYRSFSALRRLGTPAEAARAITWLALDNHYMSGKTVPVNGGI